MSRPRLFTCDGAFDVDDVTIMVNRVQLANSKWQGTVRVEVVEPTTECVAPIRDASGKQVGCARYGTRTVEKSSRVGGFLEIAPAK